MSTPVEVRVTVHTPGHGLYAEWSIDGVAFMYTPSEYSRDMDYCGRDHQPTSGWFPPGYNAGNIAQLNRSLGTHTYTSGDYDRQAYMNSPLLPKSTDEAEGFVEPPAQTRADFFAEARCAGSTNL